ncbi:hypothetical protein OIB37_23305 [Streptomyces sp. NBC_00820]|uniref:hypothetical protein n=1 Tax=Streptomyces sp. NBC_00820 TaxID=2975842 RepID=UPI002ED2ED72|nr:hypothetical protein OIB37_23305 [Streptomyces sp. NBC_00820]
MSIQSTQAIQALSRFGNVSWFKLPAEYNPFYDYPQVSYMGWRYTSPREEVAQLIDDILRKLPTQVEWTLDRTRRNWLLVPTRLLREAHGLADPSFSNVVHSINVSDPDFCRNSLSDLELIIQKIQQVSIIE